jgi:hypothetical protein
MKHVKSEIVASNGSNGIGCIEGCEVCLSSLSELSQAVINMKTEVTKLFLSNYSINEPLH